VNAGRPAEAALPQGRLCTVPQSLCCDNHDHEIVLLILHSFDESLFRGEGAELIGGWSKPPDEALSTASSCRGDPIHIAIWRRALAVGLLQMQLRSIADTSIDCSRLWPGAPAQGGGLTPDVVASQLRFLGGKRCCARCCFSFSPPHRPRRRTTSQRSSPTRRANGARS